MYIKIVIKKKSLVIFGNLSNIQSEKCLDKNYTNVCTIVKELTVKTFLMVLLATKLILFK